MKGIAERLVLLLAVGLALAACRGQGPTVEAGDPAFVVREGRLFYNEQPFTGVVRSVIPALNQVELTAFRTGYQHGITREETTDGKPIAERSYYAGAKHGIHKTWHPNGKLRSQAEFRYGKYVGEAWSWYPSGNPFDYKKWNDQSELLVAKRWRDDGQIYMNQVFRNGQALGMPGSKLCDPAKSGTEQQPAALGDEAGRGASP